MIFEYQCAMFREQRERASAKEYLARVLRYVSSKFTAAEIFGRSH